MVKFSNPSLALNKLQRLLIAHACNVCKVSTANGTNRQSRRWVFTRLNSQLDAEIPVQIFGRCYCKLLIEVDS